MFLDMGYGLVTQGVYASPFWLPISDIDLSMGFAGSTK